MHRVALGTWRSSVAIQGPAAASDSCCLSCSQALRVARRALAGVERNFSTETARLAKKKSASTSRYTSRQSSDPYVLARTSPSHASSLALPSSSEDDLPGEKFVSRSAFKLFQLEEKHHFLAPRKGKGKGRERVILDLGAAPGGWTQMALRLLRTASASEQNITDERTEDDEAAGRPPIFALDLLPLHPSVQALPGVNFIQGDFESEDVKKRLGEQVRLHRSQEGGSTTDDKVDVVLSDMLANTTGSSLRDGALSLSLLYHLYHFAQRHLAASPSSFLVLKIFPSPEAEAFRRKMLQYSASSGKKRASLEETGGAVKGGAFETVKTEKPPGSRKESREVYWVCKGFRGSEKCWTLDEWYEMEEAAG